MKEGSSSQGLCNEGGSCSQGLCNEGGSKVCIMKEGLVVEVLPE